jgi:hypothetical protein
MLTVRANEDEVEPRPQPEHGKRVAAAAWSISFTH